MKRCVIVGGAKINNYSEIKKQFSENDFFIFCDSGLLHEDALGVSPDLIIGDFDSHPKPHSRCEIISLPREKDDTDTFFAAKEALRRGFSDFLLIGAVGGRFDHSLANISILLMLHGNGACAKLADDFCEMEIVDSSPKYIPDSFPYFSVMSVDGNCSDVTIENAKFPLSDAEISAGYQYAVSNEPIRGKTACVKVGRGRALLVKVR